MLLDPWALPDLRLEDSVTIGADYGGDHQGATYRTYGFVFASPAGIVEWERRRRAVRERFGLGRQIVAFKNIRDGVRSRALFHILEAADALPGLGVVVAVHRSINQLFEPASKYRDRSDLPEFGVWSKKTFEKAVRIAHFLAFLINGLCRPGQSICILTDRDSTVENEEIAAVFTKVFSHILRNQLSFMLGKIDLGTTALDDDDCVLEDFAAIADLLAGAAEDLCASYARDSKSLNETIRFGKTQRAQHSLHLFKWLLNRGTPLRKLVIKIDPSETNGVITELVRFFGHVNGLWTPERLWRPV